RARDASARRGRPRASRRPGRRTVRDARTRLRPAADHRPALRPGGFRTRGGLRRTGIGDGPRAGRVGTRCRTAAEVRARHAGRDRRGPATAESHTDRGTGLAEPAPVATGRGGVPGLRAAHQDLSRAQEAARGPAETADAVDQPYEAASSTRVRAANPVAPGTTSS